jgi:predicted SprT family Zn-dependent metalloprotease
VEDVLIKYVPERAIQPCVELIKKHRVYLQIVGQRKTRHGDYRKLPTGQVKITVNASLNKYKFLMTLIHEFAHLVAYEKYGYQIKPHGLEWKNSFQKLMLPFLRPEIYPSKLLPLLARHFRNPTASSDTDAVLSVALKEFDPPNLKNYIFEIPIGNRFRLENGRIFKKGRKRIKRYECTCEQTGQVYVFQPHAEVEPI